MTNPFKRLRNKYEAICVTCTEIIKICNDIKDHSINGNKKTSNGIPVKVPTHTYDPEIFIPPPPKKKEESPIQIPLYIDLPIPIIEPEKG